MLCLTHCLSSCPKLTLGPTGPPALEGTAAEQ